MKNYLSVWLPHWAIERRSGYLALEQGNALPANAQQPLVLSTMTLSGAKITAANGAAHAQGLSVGMPVADARAIYPALLVEAADPEGDKAGLLQLALWCQRYSPLTRADAPDGITLDITGCTHLFDGESGLIEDLADRLHGFGLSARLAIAPNLGAGWAVARHGVNDITIIPNGGVKEHISALPVAGLRLEATNVSALTKVGLERIGMLIDKPRPPLVRRFGSELILRVDQALGTQDERFTPIFEAPFYRTECRFAEPIITLEAVEDAARHLTHELAQVLYQADKATSRLMLTLFRVDGWHESFELRISQLSRDANHLARLLCERLDAIQDSAGFGFEMATLSAFDVETPADFQHGLTAANSDAHPGDISQLLDRLTNRFGANNVTRFSPQASYVPERAARTISVLNAHRDNDWATHNFAVQGSLAFARPLLLFENPEPITVLVEMPDKPPSRFEWHRIAHRITRADGPERIAPEWWISSRLRPQTRDYYRVEDDAGQRFWLYRDGLYERADDTPRWFIHGMFA